MPVDGGYGAEVFSSTQNCFTSTRGEIMSPAKKTAGKKSARKKTARKKTASVSSAEKLPIADVTQFEPLARRRLSQMAYDYVRSGGGDEITMRENRLGFERLRLAPNILV